MEKQSFLRNHADTLTIVGVNLAIAAILFSMWISNTARVDSSNARIDSMNLAWQQERIAFYQDWKEERIAFYQDWKEESKDFHGRLCAIEERNRK